MNWIDFGYRQFQPSYLFDERGLREGGTSADPSRHSQREPQIWNSREEKNTFAEKKWILISFTSKNRKKTKSYFLQKSAVSFFLSHTVRCTSLQSTPVYETTSEVVGEYVRSYYYIQNAQFEVASNL